MSHSVLSHDEVAVMSRSITPRMDDGWAERAFSPKFKKMLLRSPLEHIYTYLLRSRHGKKRVKRIYLLNS